MWKVQRFLELVRGLASMTDPFGRFAQDLRKAGRGIPLSTVSYLDLVAGRILASAKKNAPVRTGALRRSGRIEKADSIHGPVRIVSFGGVGTGVMYAAAVEFGRFNPVGLQRGSTVAPRPYLVPALLKEMRASRGAMKKVLNQNLKHLNKTYRGTI